MSVSTNQRKVIRTTLGDLIAAVTDEVKPFVRDSSGLYMMVSHILNDVLARHRLRAHKRSVRKYRRNFAQESMCEPALYESTSVIPERT
jgi:hypothetical protein